MIEWSEEVAKLENSEVSEVHTVSRISYQIHVQVLNRLPQLNRGHTHTNTCDNFFKCTYVPQNFIEPQRIIMSFPER